MKEVDRSWFGEMKEVIVEKGCKSLLRKVSFLSHRLIGAEGKVHGADLGTA